MDKLTLLFFINELNSFFIHKSFTQRLDDSLSSLRFY